VDYGSLQETIADSIDHAGAGLRVQCPTCGNEHPHRLERKGFFEVKILPMFGYYPWLCGACKTSFWVRKRYRRKTKPAKNMVQ